MKKTYVSMSLASIALVSFLAIGPSDYDLVYANQSQDEVTTSRSSQTTYEVQAGDNLYQIALRFGISLQDLKEINGLDSDFIQIGDILIIPDSGQGEADPVPDPDPEPNPEPNPEPQSSPEKLYTVKAGDNLYNIARSFGVSLDALKKINGLTSNFIQIGEVLIIPDPAKEYPDPEPEPDPDPSPEKLYTVKAGDNLYNIARSFGVSLDALKKINGLTSNFIQIGDVLIIPDPAKEYPDPEPEPDPDPSPEKQYTVKSGDNLYNIARKFGISLDALKQANNLTSNLIFPGQILIIP
ncbi:LysM peptidoglycan-binding domain-containing protein [Eremococcus coleocola]|uniref:Putative endopeptidase LytE n=2 Tax=Eremococcus TaxID=171412 RepID=E4KPS6_9LACT|nr:LysM peptidoglycan-binding domain-containing protein [Eremococcus coleocola]EFR31401.1 putative endopeptidase LytE [Eremococcus coleocola ACS-139-V-Col8]